MKVEVIATTSTENLSNKNDFNHLSGLLAGICYMPTNFDKLKNQTEEKILKRSDITKKNGHHSVFEHEYITFVLTDVPKLFAMVLNNQKTFVTSEKSARYTVMETNEDENILYNKWKKIFTELIQNKYKTSPYFTEKRIDKLAMENARYMISIYTNTTMAYTVSYRQLNYLYSWLQDLKKDTSEYIIKLKPCIDEFCEAIKQLNFIDEDLINDGKNREISLFEKCPRKEYFGAVYSTNYKGSWASFAQAQRHRTINYEISIPLIKEFYVPKLIKNNEKLKQMWLDDLKSIEHLHPQAELININERSLPEYFILKAKERLCTAAQLEVMEQTKKTLEKYIDQCQDSYVKLQLLTINNGARCVDNNYNCKQPCGFKQGIDLSREI